MFAKRRRNKEIRKKILYNKTISSMRKYVANLDSQKNHYIKMAKEARLNSADAQYNLAINGLKMALAYQKKAKEMLLNFELTMQLRDLSQVTSEFLNGMVDLSKSMSKIINNQDFEKVQQTFAKAMSKVDEQNVQLEVFMDSTEQSFEGIAADPGSISDEEINKLVEHESEQDNRDRDSEIEAKIKAIDKILSDL